MKSAYQDDLLLALPTKKHGTAEITRDTPSALACAMSRMRGMPLSERPITMLHVNDRLMMSDGDNERRTNASFVYSCHGDVLIAGLGIGLIIGPAIAKPEVTSITVVELNQDVIDLIGPHYQSPKLTIVHEDIRTWDPAKGQKFNVIYFDIWPDICTDNLEEIKKLHRRFRKCLDRSDPNAWMDSWVYDELRYRRSRERY